MPSSLTKEFVFDLSAWEGQFVEFKESPSDSLAREMVAFANSEGGRIYLGVTDQKRVKGITINNKLLSQIQDVARHCDPSISIELAPFKHQGHDLLLIKVSEGKKKPYGCSAGYFLRTGPNSQKLNRDELVEFVQSLDPIPYERRDCKEFAYPKDFDRESFRTFLRRAEVSTKGLSSDDLLVNLGLARREGAKKLLVNNAGVLFFAKEPVRFLPQARVTCVLYQNPERVDILDRKDLQGGLFQNAEAAEVFLLNHLRVRYEIEGMRRVNHHEVPIKVLREGIVNALMHRDYGVYGGNVFIEIDPTKTVISNPGGLPAGLSPKEFGKKSVHRNPLIADLFYRTGGVERVGSGISRIQNGLASEHILPAKFEFTSFFNLIFPRYSPDEWSALAKEAGPQVPRKYPTSTRQVPDKLNVLKFCTAPRTIREMLSYVGLRDRETFMSNYLHPLLREKLLAMTNPESPNSPKQKYVTTSKGLAQLKKAS